MSAQPWLKFYPSDWRADPALRMCGLAARGLWIEMISLMHEAEPYGHLIVAGVKPTVAQIASLTGAPADQVEDLIHELESAGVFSRTGDGVIVSRKMVRSAEKARVDRENGRRGGNPSLKPTGGLTPPDNPGPKPNGKGTPFAQIPDTRVQNPERDSLPPPPDPTAAREPVVVVQAPDPTFRERILVAMGHDATGVTATGRIVGNPSDMLEATRWQRDLGLDEATILAVVAEVMAVKRDGAPTAFRYFTGAMQRRSGELHLPPLQPIAQPAKPPDVPAFDLEAFKRRNPDFR